MPSVGIAVQGRGDERGISALTKVAVGLCSIDSRAKEGEQDDETVSKSKDGPCHPSGGMKLVKQQTEGLCGNHL